MGTGVAVVVLIVAVLAFGFLRESRRSNAVTRWCTAHAFAVVPAPEVDRQRLVAWAERFRPHNSTHWGLVLRRQGGEEFIVAEHSEKSRTGPERWHTIAVARVPGLEFDGMRITRAQSQIVRQVTDALAAPGRAVRSPLGIEVTEKLPIHTVGKGQWAVEAANDEALAFWSSAPQVAAIDAWRHDAELAAIDDYVLVRMPGLISASNLDGVLTVAEAARAFFMRAARSSET